jgi:PAS domain S-box-containing protein
LGYGIEELRTLRFSQLVHPDNVAQIMDLIDRMLAGEIDNSVMESRCLGKDGKSVWAWKSVSLVRDAQGKPQWIVVVIEDITERRQTERRRERLVTREGFDETNMPEKR